MPDAIQSNDLSGSPPSPRRADPDPHGQAALLLSESILHTLVEAGTLTFEQAIGAVQSASEVKEEVAEEIGEAESTIQRSLGLLSAIERSLAVDDKRKPDNVHVLPT